MRSFSPCGPTSSSNTFVNEMVVNLERFKDGRNSGENGVIGRRFDGETVLEGRIGHATSAHVEVGFLMMNALGMSFLIRRWGSLHYISLHDPFVTPTFTVIYDAFALQS